MQCGVHLGTDGLPSICKFHVGPYRCKRKSFTACQTTTPIRFVRIANSYGDSKSKQISRLQLQRRFYGARLPISQIKITTHDLLLRNPIGNAVAIDWPWINVSAREFV